MAESVEEMLLDDYMNTDYPGVSNDHREEVRNTVGFRIHVLSYYHKELGNACKERMQMAKEQFIKLIFIER